jgi:hypothetical protein
MDYQNQFIGLLNGDRNLMTSTCASEPKRARAHLHTHMQEAIQKVKIDTTSAMVETGGGGGGIPTLKLIKVI